MDGTIKLLIVDIDGTMTNGHVLFDHLGNVSKSYHTRDITGLYEAQKAGIEVVMVTGSRHACDRHRFEYLSRPGLVFDQGNQRPLEEVLIQGVHDKVAVITSILRFRGWSWEETAMIGDAENDIDALRQVGMAACPSDAHDDVRKACNFVCHYKGGDGAVRELTDALCRVIRFAGEGV